ncbi:MAG: serine/threonine protein kinase [Burkholderiales bacterium]|nr:serine/threonine protein kinase [Burkholderiales bacterium]
MDSAPVVAGYRLEGLIGSGSHGEVYCAIDPRTGGRVALKLLHAVTEGGAAAEDRYRSFEAEAASARRLVHPDIVRVHAAGESDGKPWIAMELLPGCDLVRYTRPARLLPEAVVLRLAARVADALAHAHELGVIHRDVKPANVMVDWASDRVTLTDFGIARLADGERTRTGVVLGTPAYMAPEQLAGAPADASGDLYALGVMLFQLLAGRLPHEGDTMGALLHRIATEPAPDLATLRPGLDTDIAALVAALLAKSAARRPPGAAAVAARLRELEARLEAGGGGRTRRAASGAKSRE